VLAALAALLYRSRGAVHLQEFSGTRLWSAVAEARIGLLLAALAAIYVAYAVRTLRWMRFCRNLGRVSFAGVYSATVMGFAAIFVLGRAGEPVRPLLVARKCRLSVSSMFGIYILERVFDTAATAVLAGISLMVLPGLLSAGGDETWVLKIRASGGLLLAGFLGFIALLVYLRVHGAAAMDRLLAGWRSTPGWRCRLATQFSGFTDGLQAIRTFSDLLAALFYSAVHWALIACVYMLVMRSFKDLMAVSGFHEAMLVLAVTMVGSLVQLPGVGGGSQVASFIALHSILGAAQEPAMAAAIVLWLISFAGACLLGVPLLIREGWSMGDLRRMARDEAELEASGKHVSGTNRPQIGAHGPQHEKDSAP
jgi:glycosyltransferase 2 family protein